MGVRLCELRRGSCDLQNSLPMNSSVIIDKSVAKTHFLLLWFCIFKLRRASCHTGRTFLNGQIEVHVHVNGRDGIGEAIVLWSSPKSY